MSNSDDKNQLAEIIDLIDLVRRHLESCHRHEFMQDRHRIDATAYRLQAIGESSIRLSDDLKNQYQDIFWPDIRDMRHLLSHHYGKVDPPSYGPFSSCIMTHCIMFAFRL
jgi:uncharacterized protein with HEPN domain